LGVLFAARVQFVGCVWDDNVWFQGQVVVNCDIDAVVCSRWSGRKARVVGVKLSWREGSVPVHSE